MNQKPTPRSWIRQVASRIASRVKPLRIVLFGSYAYGKPHRDSDLDLLVILRQNPANRLEGYRIVNRAVGSHRWPIDILVRGREEVESRLNIGDSFMMEILDRGKVLYESAGGPP
jgi:predicted nucleotidyltransferase